MHSCIWRESEHLHTQKNNNNPPTQKNAHAEKFHQDIGSDSVAVPLHSFTLSASLPRSNLHFHTPLSPLPFHPPPALIRFSQHRSHSLYNFIHTTSPTSLLALMSNSFSLISLAPSLFFTSPSCLSSSLCLRDALAPCS